MRSRINDYLVVKDGNYIKVTVKVPSEVYAGLSAYGGLLTASSKKVVEDSIRLIANETTGGTILYATGSKIASNMGVIEKVSKDSDSKITIYLRIDKLIAKATSDGESEEVAALGLVGAGSKGYGQLYTVELDWGSEPESLTTNLFNKIKDLITSGGSSEDEGLTVALTNDEVREICIGIWAEVWGEVLHTQADEPVLDEDGNPIGFPYFYEGVMYTDGTFNNGVIETTNGEFNNGVLKM